ncbi:PREDICTED: uncharacterized protein LOC109229780 [Nicotiana attenuata]|uniref:uncharacterized protein LOC109229780 n=1 Tax=Nicotiana attenuata TaxID=49451 RepID=UPI00090485E5|nr:PREDICTED: uncharacterized protein LOC109229780 [Nicotiana attenuata]
MPPVFAMAKGRGRRRVRPRKHPLTTFASSMVTGNQPPMEKATPPSSVPTPSPSVPIADPANGGVACEIESTLTHPSISKRLDLASPTTIGHLPASSTVPVNGTVKLKNRFATNGNGPGYNAMKQYINLHWSHVAEPDLFYQDEGYYIIRFQTIADAQEILCAGPYSIANKPIILKPWTPDFDFTEEFPTVIPLWVKFTKLPMSCWGVGSLSRIASVIKTLVFADECTTKQTRVSFARMLIEVNVTKELPTEIMVMDPNGKKFLQDVTYDWKPAYCDKCLVVGYKCSNQP